jgi:hypothetical protein
VSDRIKLIEKHVNRAEAILGEKGAPLEGTAAGHLILALRIVVDSLKDVIAHEIDDPTQPEK